MNVQSIMRRRSAYGMAAAALLALLPAATAHAAERLTLTNGFDVVCDHHALVDGRVRVYPKATVPDYFELGPDAIRTVEMIPDAPAEPAAERASQIEIQKPVAMPADTRLTSADLRQLLAKAGLEHNVDVDLLASVVKAESGGNARAISHAGAQGLMQLMPGTAHQLGVTDSFSPNENLRGGTAYLDSLLTRYHDNIVLALAAYNAGPESVDRYHGVPPYRETRAYVARVIHEFNRRVRMRNAASHGVGE